MSTAEGRQATPGDLNQELLETDIWTDDMVQRSGIPVVDVPFVTIGGGMGSFMITNFLRNAGVPTKDMRILSVLDAPWQTYEYLTQVSQVPRGERLRSDSQSMPDNMWGFPSFAFREAWADKKFGPIANVLTEPIINDYFTPRAGQVFSTMEREAHRMGYWEMLAKGQARMVRRRAGGGYFSILTPTPGTTPTKRVAYRSRFVHLAVGYPGVKFLPDLQDYRTKHPDAANVVNAYEPHEQVYEGLQRRPGLVVIRGGGIVASRVLQRLIDDRDQHGLQTQILHLFRTYKDAPYGPSIFLRRPAKDGWTFQGFNWPKACWGGVYKAKLESLEGDDRKAFYEVLNSTNTPNRKDWKAQLKRGRAEGWYRTYQGKVESVVPGADGQVVTHLQGTDGSMYDVPATYIIDATGLEADIREHRLMADLLDHSGAGRNPLGKLDVERTFEVRGVRSEPGAMYASGTMTLGGYFAGVDTFLGLQYAALRIMDDLARQGFCTRMGVTQSVAGWWRWARHKPIPA